MSLPSPQPKFHPYLTIIPVRSPVQKTHTNLGHAKSAVVAKFSAWAGAQCDMEVHEYSEDGWKILYSIKEGDVEPPWRKGELEEEARKKEEAKTRKQEAVRHAAYIKAGRAFNNEYLGTDGNTYENRVIYVEGFVEGYMQLWKETNG